VPNPGFRGQDTFTYVASDVDGTSNVATVTITVTGGKPPVANPDAYSLLGHTPLTVNAAQGVLANDTDAENDPLTAVLQSGPAHGSLTLNADGSFLYVPNNGFVGQDSFTYVAKDQDGSSNPATVTLTVNPPKPPVVANQIYYVVGAATLTVKAPGVLLGATDAENDPLTAVVQAPPSHGTLSLNPDGSFTYAPNAAAWSGVQSGATGDSFTFAARDQDGVSNVATVTLVAARNRPAAAPAPARVPTRLCPPPPRQPR
jgi:VCBS repeat-containing protein